MGSGLVLGFSEHLQTITAHNYSAITNSHTLQFAAAHTKSSRSAVFTSHCLVIDPTSVLYFHAHILTGCRLSNNQLTAPTALLITCPHWPQSKHHSSVPVSTAAFMSVWILK
jgi:hypothetical protein